MKTAVHQVIFMREREREKLGPSLIAKRPSITFTWFVWLYWLQGFLNSVIWCVVFVTFCFVLDSKCTYTRNGKRKRETECRKKESAEKGAKTEGQGRAMKRSPVLSSNGLFCDQVVVFSKRTVFNHATLRNGRVVWLLTKSILYDLKAINKAKLRRRT